jgi:two-component system, chemotaxis family, sensor kinase CheA
MADNTLSQYKDAFITEARETLQSLNQSLLRLEKNPDDPGTVNEVFRFLHNIKGMASTMGFEKITRLSHELESLMDLVRTGKRKMSGDIISAVFKGIDFLEMLVNGLEKRLEGGEIDISPVIDTIRKRTSEKNPRILTGRSVPAEPAQAEETDRPATLRVDVKILDDLMNQIGELVISKNRLQ